MPRVEGAQRGGQPIDDRPRLPVVVAQEDGEGADALDQRRRVGLAELLAELDEIALPMAKLLALANAVRPVQNAQVRAEPVVVPARGVARPTAGAALRQMAPLHRQAVA